MIWLNTGCPIVVKTKATADQSKQDETQKPFDMPFQFHNSENHSTARFVETFGKLMKREISPSQDSESFGSEYEIDHKDKKENLFFQVFQMLPICVLHQPNNNYDYRSKMLEIAKKISQSTVTDEMVRMCCLLAFDSKVEFRNKYRECGGSDAAISLLLKVHNLASNTAGQNSIDWWLQELLQYSNDPFASDFDSEFINYLIDHDTIDCGDPLLTLIITLFFSYNTITRKIIAHYGKSNFLDNHIADRKILQKVLTFSLKREDKFSFIQDIYQEYKDEDLTLRLLSILYIDDITNNKGENKDFLHKEFRLSTLRYTEYLLSTVGVVHIPTFLKYGYTNSSTSNDQLYKALLQTVLPAIHGLPENICQNIAHFENNDYKQLFEQTKDKQHSRAFIPQYFFRSDKETQLATTKHYLGFNEVLGQSDEYTSLEEEEEKEDIGKDDGDQNLLSKETFTTQENLQTNSDADKDMKALDVNVLIGMIDITNEYADDVAFQQNSSNYRLLIDKKIELEQSLFDYLAEHGDLPEYDPEEARNGKYYDTP